MSTNAVSMQIMWKYIAIIFLVIWLGRCVTDIYILVVYNDICKKFYSYNWGDLNNRIKKHQGLCNIFSNGPFNKKIRLMYNGLCMLLASMAFIKNNDVQFITELNNVKKEEEYELKAFVLALYYHSKMDDALAEKYYHQYSRCIHQDENIKFIMNYLFLKEKCTKKTEVISNAIKSFQNPAIVKLLKNNGIIADK